MNRLEDIFFKLLRSAIWNTAPELDYVPTEQEWNEIYAISKEQTVCGIMLDAVTKLPDVQKPNLKLRLAWIMLQKAIGAQNMKMNGTLANFLTELTQHSLKPYLLKGQGVAQNYHTPNHRVCGDIDIYFTPQQFGQAVNFFSSKGCELEGGPEDSHTETTYSGIKVEIHRKSATFYTSRLQRRYDEIIAHVIEQENTLIEIEGHSVNVFPPIANALQLLSHMLRHIIFSGLGLRQVCDWMLFVYKYQKDLDKELFEKYAKDLELWETYKVVTAIATDYLGLPKEYALCNISQKDKKMAKKVFCLIMEYGNFGHYGEHSVATTRKEYLESYIWKVKNCIRFHRLAKSETWNYPIWQLHSAIKILKQKK